MFEVREVLRLWLSGRGLRSIAEFQRPDRKTVRRIVQIAEGLGLDRDGGVGQLTDAFVGEVMTLIRQPRPDRHGDSWALITSQHELVKGWVDGDVPVVKIGELLCRKGVVVPERTLHRYVADKFPSAVKDTVRVVDGEPGVELQVDFGKLGMMIDPATGKRRAVQALVFTACFSRHCFVWLTFTQSIDAVIAGFEAAWEFFDGVFAVVIPDNMATIVAKADGCDPGFNQTFIEYAQSRGFLVDPARVRSPQDKPRVERNVQFVQTSFWAGEEFTDLEEAQAAVELWCRVRAGMRDHGTTHRHPVEVFNLEEAPKLLPAPTAPYDVPSYPIPKVHPDHHIEVAKALYSVPGDLIGQHVDVRVDAKLVKIFYRGELIKTHTRRPAGAVETDPDDLPEEKTAYAMRDIDRLLRDAKTRGDAVAEMAAATLDHPLPWTRMRRVYKLFGLCRTYGNERVNQACRKALDAEVAEVVVVGRMLAKALEAEQAETEPAPSNVIVGRFARDDSHFKINTGQVTQ